MLLLDALREGKFRDGLAVPEQLRPHFVMAASAALRLSANSFLDGRDPTAALMVMTAIRSDGIRGGAEALNAMPEAGVVAADLLVLIGQLEDAAAEAQRSAAADSDTLRGYLTPLREMSLDLARYGWSAMMSRQETAAAIGQIASDLVKWTEYYGNIGVLHYTLLARGHAHAAAGTSLGSDRAPEQYAESGYALLDDADQRASAAREAEHWGLVLECAHMALPLYTAARMVLDQAADRWRWRGMTVPPDVARERQVAEECRLACVETLESAGGNLLHVYLLGKAHLTLDAAIWSAVNDLRSRVPVFPHRLLSAWAQAIGDIGSAFSSQWPEQSPQSRAVLSAVRDRARTVFHDPDLLDRAHPLLPRED